MGCRIMTDMLQPLTGERRELEQRELLCEMLRLFYDKGWVSGTGGGICARLDDGRLLVAPTGVHKERVQPDDRPELERLMGNVRTAMTDRQWDKVTAACNELADTLFYLEDA